MIAASALGASAAQASPAPNVVTIFVALECLPDMKPPAGSNVGAHSRRRRGAAGRVHVIGSEMEIAVGGAARTQPQP
jgi:hypothetical protein